MPSMEQLVKDLAAKNAKLSARLAARQKDIPKMEQLLEQLAERNDMLEARLKTLEASEDSSPAASPAASPPASPALRRSPAASPALRRSPRRHAARRTPVVIPKPKPSKRATPDSVDEDEAPVKRRLSAQLGTPKTRNKKPAVVRDVRKTLVEILGANEMDAKITSGYYLDSNRFFKDGLFEDDTRAIVDYMHSSKEIETGRLSKLDIFKLACKVAKKRERYSPKLVKKPKKTAKKKYAGKNYQIKMNARAVYQALVAGKNAERSRESIVSPAVASASAAAAAASAAAAAATAEVAEAQVEECFASSDEGVVTLERYNRAAQEKRAKEKAKLVSAKAAAAERASAQAVEKAKLAAAKAAEKAKLAAAKAAKKVALAKNKSKKQGAKKKAETPHTKKKRIQSNKQDCLFVVGTAVCAFWPDSSAWYNGKVISIDYDARTAFVHYDDGDKDTAVPWDDVRVLDG